MKYNRATFFFGALLIAGCSDLCGNEQMTQLESPSGELKVVVFKRSCGATTGYSTQGSILESDEALGNEGGNLFVVGEDAYGKPSITWIDDHELKLSYLSGLDIQVFTDARNGVKITVDDVQ